MYDIYVSGGSNLAYSQKFEAHIECAVVHSRWDPSWTRAPGGVELVVEWMCSNLMESRQTTSVAEFSPVCIVGFFILPVCLSSNFFFTCADTRCYLISTVSLLRTSQRCVGEIAWILPCQSSAGSGSSSVSEGAVLWSIESTQERMARAEISTVH